MCEPRASRWCAACVGEQARARRSGDLLTVATTELLLERIVRERSCPNQVAAFAVASLLSTGQEERAAKRPREEEEENRAAKRPRKEEEKFLIVERHEAIAEEDVDPEETIEARNAYEAAFDAAVEARGLRMAVTRARKRALRDRVWPSRGFQKRNVHPNERRVVMDPVKHVYYIDGDATNTVSVSTYIHQLFPPFDKDRVSRLCAGRGKYVAAKTPADVQAVWERGADNGSARHAAIECALRAERDQIFQLGKSDAIAEAPPGFFRLLEKHPEFEFTRCELSLFDEASRICGQCDAFGRNTRTGRPAVFDWKNCREISAAPFRKGETGTHALTRELPSCNQMQYFIQVNAYRHMAKRLLEMPERDEDIEMYLANFFPDDALDPDALPLLIRVPFIDMAPFFKARAMEAGLLPKSPEPLPPLRIVPLAAEKKGDKDEESSDTF